MFFQYDPAILDAFPGLVGGVIVAGVASNGPAPDALRAAYQTEQARVKAQIGDKPLSEIPSLLAWRGAFRQFGVDPTQYRSAAESLLRRLTKKGDIPSINTLVDLGNLVSIRYALPVAVIDPQTLDGTITVHFAQGDEPYTALDADDTAHPAPGEVIFSDQQRQVIARRWCWRQSRESAAGAETRRVIITVEAHHAAARRDIEAALADLGALLDAYAPGPRQQALLGRERAGL